MEFPSQTQLFRDVANKLELAGLDDVNNTGSVANLLVNCFLTETSRLAGFAKRTYANSFIQNATGIYLDLHGEEIGLVRGRLLPAVVLAEDRILKISTPRGTLRDRIGSTIPATTEVSDASGTIRFTVAATAVPDGVKEMYVTAVCNTAGTIGNVNRGELTTISLPVTDIEVTNVEPILTGQDAEDDSLYRDRLLIALRGLQVTSASAVISTALAVPGVSHAFISDTAFGVNHPALIISGPGKIRAGLVNQVESVITPLLPFGTKVRVLAPRYRELELQVVVKTRSNGSKAALKASLQSQIRQIFGPHIPGNQIDLTTLDSSLTRQNPLVDDLDIVEVKLDGITYGTRVIGIDIHEQVILTNVNVEVI